MGFRITLGGIADPAQQERTYEDIEKILHANRREFKVSEEKTPSGTFKSYTIES